MVTTAVLHERDSCPATCWGSYVRASVRTAEFAGFSLKNPAPTTFTLLRAGRPEFYGGGLT